MKTETELNDKQKTKQNQMCKCGHNRNMHYHLKKYLDGLGYCITTDCICKRYSPMKTKIKEEVLK